MSAPGVAANNSFHRSSGIWRADGVGAPAAGTRGAGQSA